MKEIEGYNYTVDEKGVVYRKYGSLRLPMTPVNNGIGYLQVCLYSNGKGKRFYVHRLVAQAFIDNPEKYPEIDHIDSDKSNNKVENLRWVTRKMNQRKMAFEKYGK